MKKSESEEWQFLDDLSTSTPRTSPPATSDGQAGSPPEQELALEVLSDDASIQPSPSSDKSMSTAGRVFSFFRSSSSAPPASPEEDRHVLTAIVEADKLVEEEENVDPAPPVEAKYV
jgi:hypothetical protein